VQVSHWVGKERGVLVELEQRVKVLEYEIKILKHEMHRALLEIQEQVLIHYYPDLRSVETFPSKSISPSFEAMKEQKIESGETTTPPEAKASLNEARTTAKEPPGHPRGQPPFRFGEEAERKLSEWMGDTVARIGAGRTRKLIEVYARKDLLVPEVKEIILKLAPPADEGNLEKPMAVNEILTALLKLNELLDQEVNVEAALELIEEANLG
jgi:hypothetical protein